MPVQITIRGVPNDVRDVLAARAARQGQSMQQFLRLELERIASRPSINEWLRETRQAVDASGSRVPGTLIVDAVRADRK